jgi:hypothetical protein
LASENKFVFLNFFNSVTTSVRCMLMQGTHGRASPRPDVKILPGQALVRERYTAFLKYKNIFL